MSPTPHRLPTRLCALLVLLLGLLGLSPARADEVMLEILAQARLSYTDPVTGITVTTMSNRVEAMTPEAVPTLGFFSSDTANTRMWMSSPGKLMFPRLRASACNVDPLVRETLSVTMHSVQAQQTKQFTAIETAPNTGMFELKDDVIARLWTPNNPPNADALDVLPGDMVEASAPDCTGQTMRASLRIEARAFVFDAGSGRPLAGELVQLIDVSGNSNGGNPGGPAVVFQADGVTPMSGSLVTDADGGYVFPFLVAGDYRLVVRPVDGYGFPAAQVANGAARNFTYATVPASFGAVFTVGAQTNAVIVNVPLDPLPRGLSVQKTASRTVAEVAETLEYVVTVKNVGQQALTAVRLQDRLPLGFRYVPGTSRLDGKAVADPTGSAGPRLEWPLIDSLPAAVAHTLRYRVRIGTGAMQGDGINRAQAFAQAPETITSNLATAKVKVEAGVFSDRAIVMGTVYADCDANGVKDADEPGIPGVRLWMEDGTSVVTDGAGRYSLYGLSPRTHVLKLDPVTLPAGATPLAISHRHAGDGRSRFVDLTPGELQRADFALGGCSPALRDEVRLRVATAGQQGDEITGTLRTALSPTATAIASDVRALPASGRLGDAPTSGGLGGFGGAAGITGSIGSPGLAGSLGSAASFGSMAMGSMGSMGPFGSMGSTSAMGSRQSIGAMSAADMPITAPSASANLAAPPVDAAVAALAAAATSRAAVITPTPIAVTPGTEAPAPVPAAAVAPAPAPAPTAASASASASASAPAPAPASSISSKSSSAAVLVATSPVAPAAEAATSNAMSDNGPLPHFIGLRDGQVLPSPAPPVKLAGHLGTTLTLSVNGEPVGDAKIGERTRSIDDQTETRTYLGLPLRPGENRLTLTEHDAFGQLRATREATVLLAGALARIVIVAPESVEAGATAAVRLRFEDERGLPVTSRLPVTLAGPGRWGVDDLDPRLPDVQGFVEGGTVELAWKAPDVPGDALLRVAVDGVRAETRVAVAAALRPLIAVGVIDAVVNLRRVRGNGTSSGDDGFDDQLRAFAGDKKGADGRGAVFVKGEVYQDTLLTLVYDSDKDGNQRLFRDIQPDAFYPVYGDSSARSFDAQSTGRLYARIDRKQSWLLYGDYTTQSDDPIRQLGTYQRSLNGLKHHLQIGGLSANAFAARDSTRQNIVELRGDGTSGPYALGVGLVPNSEKVELLVRDRNQPALIISTTPKDRFTDYDLEPLTGRLLFRAPVPSVDADLNPISIRVTYEVEQGGPSFWVAGVDAQWQATESVQVGGSLVKDWNPLAPMRMGSANAKVALGERTALVAEVARIDRDASAVDGTAAHAGNAERFALTHDGQDLKARVHAARSDVGFDNRSALINSGRAEGGAQASYRVDERTRLTGEALYTADVASGARRLGVLVGVERSLESGAKVELGVRHVKDLNDHPGATTDDQGNSLGIQGGTTTSVRGKFSTPVPGLPQASVFIEGEQDVRDSDKHLLAVGGDYQVAGRGRVYLRHELVSSLTGPYSLDPTVRHNTTVLGVDAGTTVVGGEGRVFSEYRGREAFSGRETEAAIGLRNQWLVRPGLRLNASLERVQALRGGTGENQSSAATAGVEYTADPRWKGTARLEVREGAGSTGLLSTLGLAYKLDDQWTLLGKNVLAGTLAHGNRQPDRWQERLQLGAAYRGADNRLNALGRYEYKDERGTLGDVDSRRAHIVSVHAERQVGQGVAVTGRYAAKLVEEAFGGMRQRTTAQLASMRVTRDLGERWDVGASASVMGDARLRSRQTSLGAEVGYRAKDNLWISVGYNVRGFKDRDLSADNATARGVYLRLRFKFDETLFSRLNS
ncbi:hypothetical protein CDN99_07165 [Roseateles aquatilis]|uniref:DUF11 domain-containing protein n=1 Tax=Roseateles aquatilis TaxID=431061 RepID=A0A246JHS6_9BURK|nr:DUF11 domain-containing protein [Roseateles aquatilis]OWQ92125.1 hypothetical protein CDN99_07165 [Roseateles aquatilis]